MTEPTNDPDVLAEWVGRSISVTDTIDTTRAGLLALTFDVDAPAAGAPLPPLWHWAYFIDSVATAGLGPDGHPRRGGFLPPVALPRRMWAGGRLTFPGPLHVGDRVTKTSTILSVRRKDGATGPLLFVTVAHELAVDGTARVAEEQDLVYRDDPDPDAPAPDPPPAPTGAQWTDTVVPTEPLLFRYSALTFNAHRIHYDRRYATEVEGYPGLVVHGPLTATLLAALAVSRAGRALASFDFRARSPLFDGAAFTVSANPTDGGADLWAATASGGLAMTASARFVA